MRPILPWDVPDAHYPTGPNRANPLPTEVCPTALAPYLNPLGRRSWKPRCHQSLEPTISLDTDSARTAKALSNAVIGSLRAGSQNASRSRWLPSLPKGFPLFDFHSALAPVTSLISLK